ncbi:MAG: nicotinate (nicotinamide) nucleotide adenylyltransferase [Christensenellaceae bacterium]|jgi:nicotinate-nucleotide adenylyltransferase|nr:nicotinate (nicotinamide) nucleotide adenylyltransferase [Christensenellaceae bacterium]
MKIERNGSLQDKNLQNDSTLAIGILGGAFDPFHIEHCTIIESAITDLRLDALVLVPSHNPPHKDKHLTPFKDRIEMLKLFSQDKPYIIIDTIENDVALDNSYTSEIIPRLKEKYGGIQYYIIGADGLFSFETWHAPEKILQQITLAVAPRKGYHDINSIINKLTSKYGGEIRILSSNDESAISSSELKARLELDYDTKGYIKAEIFSYIKNNGLYREYAQMLTRLKQMQDDELYAHSARTAIFASRYVRVLKIDFRSAFIASVLHDVAKQIRPLKNQYPTNSSKIIHQYDGRVICESVFGITDELILDAVEYHTTGKPNMSPLGILVYVADKLEDDRSFDGIDSIRSTLDEDFHAGFVKLLQRNVTHIKSKNMPVDELTLKACDYYKINRH